jgi:hypothetical protein
MQKVSLKERVPKFRDLLKPNPNSKQNSLFGMKGTNRKMLFGSLCMTTAAALGFVAKLINDFNGYN